MGDSGRGGLLPRQPLRRHGDDGCLGQVRDQPPSGTTLPEGFQRAQIVVVGQPDEPPPSPLPGLASSLQLAFRIDKTAPRWVTNAFIVPGTPLVLPGQTPN